jgi:hypothetical protein
MGHNNTGLLIEFDSKILLEITELAANLQDTVQHAAGKPDRESDAQRRAEYQILSKGKKVSPEYCRHAGFPCWI